MLWVTRVTEVSYELIACVVPCALALVALSTCGCAFRLRVSLCVLRAVASLLVVLKDLTELLP